jgi:hypothetical protein
MFYSAQGRPHHSYPLQNFKAVKTVKPKLEEYLLARGFDLLKIKSPELVVVSVMERVGDTEDQSSFQSIETHNIVQNVNYIEFTT